MQRHLFSTIAKQIRPPKKTETTQAAEAQQDLRQPLKRLTAIEHDFATIPGIFCDSITLEPLDQPILLGKSKDHAVEKELLMEDDLAKVHVFYKNGKYLNPHNRQGILLPYLFDVERQKVLQDIIERVLLLRKSLQDDPHLNVEREKASLSKEITELVYKILAEIETPKATEWARFLNNVSSYQADLLLTNVLPSLSVLESQDADEIKVFLRLKEELDFIKNDLDLFQNQEAQRNENERWLKEKYENYVSSLEKIHGLQESLVSVQTSEETLKLGLRLKEALATFINETLLIIDPSERDHLAKQETLLKELMSPHYEEIYLLKQKLENLNINQGNSLDTYDNRPQHVVYKLQEATKQELTKQLLAELIIVRDASITFSEKEKETFEELNSLIHSLKLSLAPPVVHASPKPKKSSILEKEYDHVEFEKEDPMENRGQQLRKLGLFLDHTAGLNDKGKGKEKDKEKEVENRYATSSFRPGQSGE